MFKALSGINTHQIIETFMSPSVSFLGIGYIGSFSIEPVKTLSQFEADEQLVTGDMSVGVKHYNVEQERYDVKLSQITISHPALVNGDFIIREELSPSGLSTTFYNDGRDYTFEEVYNDFKKLNELYKGLTVTVSSTSFLMPLLQSDTLVKTGLADVNIVNVTNPNNSLGAGCEVCQFVLDYDESDNCD